MKRLMLAGALVSVILAGRVQGQAAPGRTDLPANQWVKVGEKAGGCRVGSAVVWLEQHKRFLVVAGLRVDKWTRKAGIPSVAPLMTYDPSAGAWEAWPALQGAGPFKFRPEHMLFGSDGKGHMTVKSQARISGSFAPDPAGNRLFAYTGPGAYTSMDVRVYQFDIAANNWALLSRKAPPAETPLETRTLRGLTVPYMRSAVPVFDPVNQEVLFIGGQTANDPDGFIGNWAFSVKDKRWRDLAVKDAVLDPLHGQVRTAVRITRDAMAAARNVYYATMPAADELQAMKGRPAGLLTEAVTKTKAALAGLEAAKPDGWKQEAVTQARSRVSKALAAMEPVAAGFAAGEVSAALLKGVFSAAWLLDEAADCVRAFPGARFLAGVGYDPANRSVLVFGGDHGDYLLNDTWVYECETRTWRQVFPAVAPKARMAAGKVFWLPKQKRLAVAGGRTNPTKFYHQQRATVPMDDVWSFDRGSGEWSLLNPGGGKGPRPNLTSALAVGDDDVMLGLSVRGKYQNTKAEYWMMRMVTVAGADASKVGVPAGTRTYFSITKEYDPCWYDAAPRGSRKTVEDWLAKLKPNTWTAVPRSPRPAPRREWGTVVFDPDRDQWYHWSGGHMADLSDMVSTYHPAINRWSVPYVGGILSKGVGFNGRPDCRNHTYLSYDYDPVSKKLVTVSTGGTCVYDPDRREFEPRIDSPTAFHPFYVCVVGTPKGVVYQGPGFFGVLDVAERKWKKLPIKGSYSPPKVDGTGLCYDSKRDVIWNASFLGYQKPSGKIWRYDMKTGVATELKPKNLETIGKDERAFRTLREMVYLPKMDLVLFNNFYKGRQVAYDPTANAWVLLGTGVADPKRGRPAGVSVGLMYDARRDLVWAMDGAQKMFVIRLDPETLTVVREPGE